MFIIKWKIAAIGVLALGIFAFKSMGNPRSATAAPVPESRKAPKELLEKRRDAAERVFLVKLQVYRAGIGSPKELIGWSERVLEADLALVQNKADQIAALKRHLNRTREVERIVIAYFKAEGARQSEVDAANYERIGAEIRIFEATGEIPPPPVSDKPVPIPKLLKPVERQEKQEGEEVRERQLRLMEANKEWPQREVKEDPPAKDRQELLQRRLRAARRTWEEAYREFVRVIERNPSEFFGLSERWLEAELALLEKKEERIAASKAHVDRTRYVEDLATAMAKFGRVNQSDVAAATYERIGADIRYFLAVGELPPPPPKPTEPSESLSNPQELPKKER